MNCASRRLVLAVAAVVLPIAALSAGVTLQHLSSHPSDLGVPTPYHETSGQSWRTTLSVYNSNQVTNPTTNQQLSPATQEYCWSEPDTANCITSALGDIDNARSGEGVPAMQLPADFAQLTVPEQLLVIANLERVDRGLTPLTGLSAGLDANAAQGAADDADPVPNPLYGYEWGSNWAGGYPSSLVDDFLWMYDDGPGSGNIDCESAGDTGCWGHRDNILASYGAPIMMGAGYVASTNDGASLTELFIGGDTATGSGEPDAPIFTPTGGTSTTTTAPTTTTTAAPTTTTTTAPTTTSRPSTPATPTTTTRPSTTAPSSSTTTALTPAPSTPPSMAPMPPVPTTTAPGPRPTSGTTSTTRPGPFVPTTTVPGLDHHRHRSSHANVPAVSLPTAMVTVSGTSAATTVRCEGATCRGDVRLWYRNIQLGHAYYHAQPGGSVTLALRLAPGAQVLVSRWAGKVVAVTETASVKGGHTVSKQVKLQVR
jgi:hypothetical protein